MARKSRLLWIVLGLLLIGGGGVWFFIAHWLSFPVGSGPAGPAVTSAAFERVWSEQPVLLMGIGDSMTRGFGASPGHSYFELIADNAVDEWPEMRGRCLRRVLPSLQVQNLSLSGSDSLRHERMVRDLPVQSAQVHGLVMMTSGGNDLIHSYGQQPPRECAMYGASHAQAGPWIANFEARLGRMLDDLQAKFPGGLDVFLANIYDPTDGVGAPGYSGLPAWPDGLRILAEYNAVIERCASSRPWVHVVDVRATFLGHGIKCRQFWRDSYDWADPHFWYGYNIEDPNDRGYDALRRVFLNRIAQVMTQKVATTQP